MVALSRPDAACASCRWRFAASSKSLKKIASARRARALVSHGDAIILDSSSTALAIARHLKRHRDLTILTNRLVIAYDMLDAPGVTVVMPGGTVRRDMASLIGGNSLELFRKFNIKKGFLWRARPHPGAKG